MRVNCRLCDGTDCHVFASLDRRYWHCPTCGLVFVDEADLPGREREMAEYDLHENDVGDPGYRRFLSQLADPLITRLGTRADRQTLRALDFGSGPAPALAEMLNEAGLRTLTYDPIFDPRAERLELTYDIVTCTETVEHFHDPRREFRTLSGLLTPGGCLAVMTQLRDEAPDFERWHYRRDVTHVALYSLRTMAWIAEAYGWELECISPRVQFFHRPPARFGSTRIS